MLAMDGIAQRYGQLPSAILQAHPFDLGVALAATTVEQARAQQLDAERRARG